MVYEKSFYRVSELFLCTICYFHFACFCACLRRGQRRRKIRGHERPSFSDGTTGIDSNIYTMLNYYKEQNVDAILVLGDVANSAKETQFAKFTTAWDSVFTDAESAPKRLVIMGNHEFENAYYKRETVADAQQRYMTAYGYDTLNFNVKVNGYHFIGINSESAAIDGDIPKPPFHGLSAA